MTPELSIIIPTLNSAKALEQCLKAIQRSIFTNYEIIVIDGGSSDGTCEIAGRYTQRVIRLQQDKGRGHARNIGIQEAKGDILVFVDSDDLIPQNALAEIHEYLSNNPDVSAVTGGVCREHPNQDFFSQYKNLYMFYKLSRLRGDINFLQGDIYAVRKKETPLSNLCVSTDDTERGQALYSQGKRIVFLKDLKVQHLKHYSFLSLLKNDFQIPYEWARIFLKYQGWRQILSGGRRFAHTSLWQVLSLMAAALTLLIAFSLPGDLWIWTGLLWLALNLPFFIFLSREKGIFFMFSGVAFTFLDQLVMLAGVCAGLFRCLRAVVSTDSSA